MRTVHALMKRAIEDGVFPGAVLLVSRNSACVFFEAYGCANIFSGRPVTRETVFDLASLTKPLATTLAVMRLVEQRRLHLDQPLKTLLAEFENSPGGDISVAELLGHTAGLVAYRPFYRELIKGPAPLRRSALTRRLAEEIPLRNNRKQALYSDLGFMILARVVATISGRRLDRFVHREVYAPLGVEGLFFVDLEVGPDRSRHTFAATEECPWRKTLLEGVVHDENAYAVGGIDGHAGLFGNAAALNRLLDQILSDYHGGAPQPFFNPRLLRHFLRRNAATGRALGFDCPSRPHSSSGRYFPEHAVGHLGFTGTSFWVDLKRCLSVVLLSNRVHPSRQNERIRQFRPKLHDAVMESLSMCS